MGSDLVCLWLNGQRSVLMVHQVKKMYECLWSLLIHSEIANCSKTNTALDAGEVGMKKEESIFLPVDSKHSHQQLCGVE